MPNIKNDQNVMPNIKNNQNVMPNIKNNENVMPSQLKIFSGSKLEKIELISNLIKMGF